MLGRVRYGAALDQLRDYRPEVCQPVTAPFALYGVSARSDLRKVLGHPAFARPSGGREPDICLLDLGPPALTRLGHGWEDVLERFLAETVARFPDLRMLAVTLSLPCGLDAAYTLLCEAEARTRPRRSLSGGRRERCLRPSSGPWSPASLAPNGRGSGRPRRPCNGRSQRFRVTPRSARSFPSSSGRWCASRAGRSSCSAPPPS